MKKIMIRMILIIVLLLPVSGCFPALVILGTTAAVGTTVLLSKEKPKETPKKTPKKAVDEKAVEELDELF